MNKSKGHLAFHGEYEDFAKPDGSIWRGKRCYPIGEDGYRRHAYERETVQGVAQLFHIGFSMPRHALIAYERLVGKTRDQIITAYRASRG